MQQWLVSIMKMQRPSTVPIVLTIEWPRLAIEATSKVGWPSVTWPLNLQKCCQSSVLYSGLSIMNLRCLPCLLTQEQRRRSAKPGCLAHLCKLNTKTLKTSPSDRALPLQRSMALISTPKLIATHCLFRLAKLAVIVRLSYQCPSWHPQCRIPLIFRMLKCLTWGRCTTMSDSLWTLPLITAKYIFILVPITSN